MKDLMKIYRSVRFALSGITHAYRFEKSFRMEIHYGLPAYILIGYVLSPFSPWEFLFFVFSYVLILIVEMLNTSIELLLARLHPEEHDIIKRSKDVSAGAVLFAFTFAVIVIGILVYIRFFPVSAYIAPGVLFV